MNIELKILNKKFYSQEANGMLLNPLPHYATTGSAAVDLVCTEDVTLYPGETKMIPTGLAVHIGSHDDKLMKAYRQYWNYVGLILPRSGLGTKGLLLANTIGVIDADYQGELMVSAWNRNNEYKTVDRYSNEGQWQEIEWNTDDKIELKAGSRFAQLMFVPVVQAQFKVVEEFSTETERGQGSFGSTGG